MPLACTFPDCVPTIGGGVGGRVCQRPSARAAPSGPRRRNSTKTPRRMRLSGAPLAVTVPAPSGRPHDIYRCPTCQTALWSDYGRRGSLRFVRVGTLDDPAALPPDVHIFTRSKLPWIALPPDVPAFSVYYE